MKLYKIQFLADEKFNIVYGIMIVLASFFIGAFPKITFLNFWIFSIFAMYPVSYFITSYQFSMPYLIRLGFKRITCYKSLIGTIALNELVISSFTVFVFYIFNFHEKTEDMICLGYRIKELNFKSIVTLILFGLGIFLLITMIINIGVVLVKINDKIGSIISSSAIIIFVLFGKNLSNINFYNLISSTPVLILNLYLISAIEFLIGAYLLKKVDFK